MCPIRHTSDRQAVDSNRGDGVVTPERSYNLPLGFLGISALSFASDNIPLSVLFGILGTFLAVQATRVKFRFSKDSLVPLSYPRRHFDHVFAGSTCRR